MRFLTIFLLLAFLCQCAPLSREITQDEEDIPVVFAYADSQAKKVCLAGSFNQWSPQTHCMKKERGSWTLSIFLRPGRYQYLLLVDDQTWKLDPGAPLTEDNGFGSKNSVFIVE
jgi:1,4-alpha-glucan branching enzyme